jgi:serine/threonine protein kinase
MDFDTDSPLIFMPKCEGNLAALVKSLRNNSTDLHLVCNQVLEEMLRALDYLAAKGYIHRDFKPLNILWRYNSKSPGRRYHFQLGDFGLANHFLMARTIFGTRMYMAPEFHDPDRLRRTPKVDIWSLFVTMAEILPDDVCNFPPNSWADSSHRGIIQAVRQAAEADLLRQLRPMARVDPNLRASAAQMLLEIYGGEGLTTPRDDITPIQWDVVKPEAFPVGEQFSAQAA